MSAILPYVARPWAGLIVLSFMLVFFSGTVVAQDEPIDPCANPRMKQITWKTLSPGEFGFPGMLYHLPAGYQNSTTQQYPAIIFLHGFGGQGDGTLTNTATGLCKMIADVSQTPVHKIERHEFPETITGPGGVTTSYLVFAPQYNNYRDNFILGSPGYLNSAVLLDAVITKLLQDYRIDPTRIYLTGFSAGANIVLDYISHNVNYAKRVAAVALSSPCFTYSWRPTGGNVIAAAQLPTWWVSCTLDALNPGDFANCRTVEADAWVDGIRNAPGGSFVEPRYDRLVADPNPVFMDNDSLQYCYPWTHQTWPRLYSELNTPQAPEPNIYEWLVMHNRSIAAPVTLKDNQAKLINGKVRIQWTTSSETNNKSFTIERAGPDGRFSAIGTVQGHGTTVIEKRYEFIDDKPLPGLSYYRLVQTDLDGREKTYGSMRIMNRNTQRSTLIVSPNPFVNVPTAFLNVNRMQQVTIIITDLNGKVISNRKNQYSTGTTEVSLPVGNLPSGMYLLRVTGEDFSETHRLIKQ